MANVLFKRGLQANLPANGSAEDGVFYLTTDTNRLYVGTSDHSKKLLNQTVQFVDNIAGLGTLTTQWGASASSHVNDIYYVTGSNILAVYTGTGADSGWVQINPDTDTTNASMSLSATASSGTATVTASVTDSEGDSVSNTMDITGAGSVHITASNGDMTITGDKYTLGKTVDSNGTYAILNLTSDTAADSSSVKLLSGDSSTLSFESTSDGFKITAQDTSLQGGSTTVTANAGTLSVSVSDSEGNSASGSADRVGVVLNDGSYAPLTSSASGTSTGELYSKAEIDSMMKGLDGMTYKGTIGSSGATISALPSANVKNGDTYVVVEAGLTASSTPFSGASFETNTVAEMSAGTKIGDMIIAKGTEGSDGYITAASLEWTYIPAGNDSLDDVTYTATVDTSAHSIKLANANGTGIAKMALVAGTDVSLTSAVSTDTGANTNSTLTTTINHATITTTPTSGADVDGAASFTAITGITTSNGHVTGYTTQEYTPVTYDLEGVAITQTNTFNGTSNSGTNDATVKTRLKDSEGAYSSHDSDLKLESSTIKLTPGTGANANKLTMNFEWGSF